MSQQESWLIQRWSRWQHKGVRARAPRGELWWSTDSGPAGQSPRPCKPCKSFRNILAGEACMPGRSCSWCLGPRTLHFWGWLIWSYRQECAMGMTMSEPLLCLPVNPSEQRSLLSQPCSLSTYNANHYPEFCAYEPFNFSHTYRTHKMLNNICFHFVSYVILCNLAFSCPVLYF